MGKSDNLYSLIHSLTPSEKRFLSIHFTSNGTKTNSYFLFKAINEWKKEEFIEQDFIKQFSKRKFTKNYHYEKSTLIELVLRVMRNYNRGKSIELILLDMVQNIQFLYDKGLMDLVNKQLDKATKLAKKNQCYIELLLLNKYKQSLLTDKALNTNLEAHKKEVNNLIEQVKKHLLLHSARIDLRQQLEAVNWKNNVEKIQESIQELKKNFEEDELSFYERKMLLHIFQIYYSKIHDYENYYKTSVQIIDNYEKNLHSHMYKADTHLTALANFLNAIFMVEKLDEVIPVLEKVKQIPARTEIEKANLFSTVIQNRLLYYLNTQDYSQTEALTEELNKGLKKYQMLMAPKKYTLFICNLALLCFFRRDFRQSQIQLKKLDSLTSRKPEFRYLNVLGRTIEMMCVFSENDWTIVDYSLRSWRRLVDIEIKKEKIFRSIYGLFQLINKETFKSNKIQIHLLNIEETDCSIQWNQLKTIIADWIKPYMGKQN